MNSREAAKRTLREAAIQRVFSGGDRHPTGHFRAGRSGNPGGRPKGKLPVQHYPKRLEDQYTAALRAIISPLRKAYEHVLQAAPGLARRAYEERQRLDVIEREGDDYVVMSEDRSKVLGRHKTLEDARAQLAAVEAAKHARADAGEGREAADLLAQARRMAGGLLDQRQLESLATIFARRTADYQREQLRRQVRAVLGVDVFASDKRLAALVDDFVQHNVSLIRRIPDKLHSEVDAMVQRSVTSGTLNDDLADDLAARFSIAEDHAELIARDQIGKFYGDVNSSRQRELGVTRFIWRTARDERVRESHAELDGEEFSYDDLPTNERDEEIRPGDDIQCRCYAEPIFDDILAAGDSANEDRADAAEVLADGRLDQDLRDAQELREVQQMIARARAGRSSRTRGS